MPLPPSTDPLTLQDLIQSLGAPMSKHWWFAWPPDVFFLTSLVLKKTGWYQVHLSPPSPAASAFFPNFTDPYRLKLLHSWSAAWKKHVCGMPLTSSESMRCWEIVNLLEEVLNCRVVLNEAEEDEQDSIYRNCLVQHITENLLWLHALSDHLCSTLGLAAVPAPPLGRFNMVANLYLAGKGSLSRISKSHGVVLPKMRTAQKGLTVRNLSLNLSFHQTPVDVTWATLNLLDRGENHRHIMVFAHPHKVNPKDFQEVTTSKHQMPAGFGYFDYDAKNSPLNISEVLSALQCARNKGFRVDFLVLPELSVTLEELQDLQKQLVRHFRGNLAFVPVIVAGVRTSQHGKPGKNEVHLCHHFSHGWVNYVQSKHHRWAVDQGQIKMYSLTADFPSGHTTYWEHTHIAPRTMHFLVASDEFIYCPLICEDLAQVEPVSEVVRGVGPNLLMALLMDGSQTVGRWPGRYATVLADDPGTSVLTVSCQGMVDRANANYKPADGSKPKTMVGLWKDIRSSEELELKSPQKAVLFKVRLDSQREHTLDGRNDGGYARMLVFDKTIPLDCGVQVFVPEGDDAMEDAHDPKDFTSLTFAADYLVNASPAEVMEFLEFLLNELQFPEILIRRWGDEGPESLSAFAFILQDLEKYHLNENLRRHLVHLTRSVMDMQQRLQLGTAEFWQGELRYNPVVQVEVWMDYTQWLLANPNRQVPLSPMGRDALAFEVLLWALHNRFRVMGRRLRQRRWLDQIGEFPQQRTPRYSSVEEFNQAVAAVLQRIENHFDRPQDARG